MSLDQNILKNLLSKLLENRLKNLEKRSSEQLKDLKYTKIQYKKQGELLSKLSIKNPKKQNIYKVYTRQHTFDNIDKRLPKDPFIQTKFYYNIVENENINNQVGSFHNNKYKNKRQLNMDNPNRNEKLYLTPAPRMKKRKILREKKIKKVDTYYVKKHNLLNVIPKNNNKIESDNAIRNIKAMKRAEDYKKKIIISDIDLEKGRINFVLDYLRKEKENNANNNYGNENENENDNYNYNDSSYKDINNNSSSSSRSNSSRSSKSSSSNKIKYIIKNKKTVTKFGIFLLSSEGSDIISLISSFLDKKTKLSLLSISKKFLRLLTDYLKDLYQKTLYINKISGSNTIEAQINNLKKTYKEEELIEPTQSFSLSKGSLKALDLLNSDCYNDVFTIQQLEPPLDKITVVYRIFFQLINEKKLVKIDNDKLFWEKARNFILDNNEGKTGTFLKEYISEFDFTSKNIYKIKQLINGNEDKMKPLIYESICKTTGLIIFIIKDSLEYCGIIKNEKKMMPSIMLDYLKYLKKVTNRAKDYINKLDKYTK